jgi:hypothetical protein
MRLLSRFSIFSPVGAWLVSGPRAYRWRAAEDTTASETIVSRLENGHISLRYKNMEFSSFTE